MTMDFLDEETIEVSRGDSTTGALQVLASAGALKNRDEDLIALEHFQGYNNPLLNAGTPLLATCVALSRMPLPDDIYRFRKALVEQITQLKQRVSQLDYPATVADKCCFLFSIALDEFILHSQWGEQSSWENNTLVSDLFGVRDGGEQFFLVTEKALQQPKILADMLELIYVFIKIGFRGQYRLHGREQLEETMYRLEQAVFEGNPALNLDNLQAVPLPRTAKPRSPIRFALQLVLFCAALIIMFAASSYWFQTHRSAEAEGFSELASFNAKHLQGQKQKEAVYLSVNTEMRPTRGQKALEISRVNSTAATSSLASKDPVLTLEIAAFPSRLKAIQFLRREKIKSLMAQVIFIRDKYRVVIQTKTEARAQTLSSELQSLGFSDVFYYYYTPQEAQPLQ